jgi:hypothetical protein
MEHFIINREIQKVKKVKKNYYTFWRGQIPPWLNLRRRCRRVHDGHVPDSRRRRRRDRDDVGQPSRSSTPMSTWCRW